MATSNPPGCYKHAAMCWSRLRADAPSTPKDTPGPWFCQKCYPAPEALLEIMESFTPLLHEDPREARTIVDTGRAGVPVDVGVIEASLNRWRGQDIGWVKARIVTLARIHGEFHGEMFKDDGNVKALESLKRTGLMERLNTHGDVERRRGDYVWRLTRKGRVVSLHLRRMLGDTDRLPGPPKEQREADTDETG